MAIDIIALGLIGFFALLGAWTGALSQVVHLVGVLAAWVVGRFLGFALGPTLAGALGVPLLVGVAIGSLGLGVMTFTTIHVVGRILLRRYRREGPGPADRAGGVLLGALKSGLIVWGILSVIVFFDRPTKGLRWKFDLSGSETATLARQFNLLAGVGFPMHELERALRRAPGSNPAASSDPRIRRLAKNHRLREALRTGDYVTVLQSSQVLEILSDPQLLEKLLQSGGSRVGGAVELEEAPPPDQPAPGPR